MPRALTLVVLFASLAACQASAPLLPTRVSLAPATALADTSTLGAVPATWTPQLAAVFNSPTPAQLPSRTPRPTRTPWPTITPTPIPSNTPLPSPTATATAPPAATSSLPTGLNLLPNASFENGWYHVNGLPELQAPNQWILEWDTGTNPLDPAPWNAFVRPESRVLSKDFLPPYEHNLFIWDGEYTVKVFKGTGALSFRLMTNLYLQPGTYLFEISVFPDMIVDYTDGGEKIWAPDPLSGEVRFLIDTQVDDWITPTFGRRNILSHAFNVETARVYRLGVAFRGRWAILNNGWFLDNWSLRRAS